MKLILASTSKFKSDILNKVCMNHKTMSSNFDENSITEDDVYEYVKKLSLGKAKSIENKVDNCIILGMDTVVYSNGKILEKPKTIDEAKRNLKEASNNTNLVITGITLINTITNEIITDYQETKVMLNNISSDDIDYYIENEPNVMHASGYIIETVASNFIKKIDGSFYNILGVPVEKIYEYLLKWNIHLKDLEK